MTKNRTLAKELISDIPTKKTARQIQNMDFPIEGSKIKVVVESSVTYQNLSAEKYKTNPIDFLVGTGEPPQCCDKFPVLYGCGFGFKKR